MRRYNYVVLGSSWDIYKYSFSELASCEGADYYCDLSNSLGCLSPLYKVHTSRSVNNIIPLPFKRIWNKRLFSNIKFPDDKPVCFIIFNIWHDMNSEIRLSEFLRNNFQNCKLVWFAQDIIAKTKTYYKRRPVIIEHEKELYDLILSYDRVDCEKYKLIYHPTVFSAIDVPLDENIPKSDFYLLAKSKDRIPLINQLYQYLTERGFTCDFILLNVSQNLRIENSTITYLDEPIIYFDNLRHVRRTKCLIEIMQDGAVGSTFRVWESIAFEKFLLSNNQALKNENFYNESNMEIFSDLSEISNLFLDKIRKGHMKIQDKNFMSPLNFLNFIDGILSSSLV